MPCSPAFKKAEAFFAFLAVGRLLPDCPILKRTSGLSFGDCLNLWYPDYPVQTSALNFVPSREKVEMIPVSAKKLSSFPQF